MLMKPQALPAPIRPVITYKLEITVRATTPTQPTTRTSTPTQTAITLATLPLQTRPPLILRPALPSKLTATRRTPTVPTILPPRSGVQKSKPLAAITPLVNTRSTGAGERQRGKVGPYQARAGRAGAAARGALVT